MLMASLDHLREDFADRGLRLAVVNVGERDVHEMLAHGAGQFRAAV
jgi:hypothetical protein